MTVSLYAQQAFVPVYLMHPFIWKYQDNYVVNHTYEISKRQSEVPFIKVHYKKGHLVRLLSSKDAKTLIERLHKDYDNSQNTRSRLLAVVLVEYLGARVGRGRSRRASFNNYADPRT